MSSRPHLRLCMGSIQFPFPVFACSNKLTTSKQPPIIYIHIFLLSYSSKALLNLSILNIKEVYITTNKYHKFTLALTSIMRIIRLVAGPGLYKKGDIFYAHTLVIPVITEKMKGACIIILLLLALVCATVSANGRGFKFDSLAELMKVQRTRTSKNYVSESEDDGSSARFLPVYVGNQEGLKEADRIVRLPGQPRVGFSQYSGYVAVDPDAGRALFYYFAESEHSSANPLVLWLNGGPGCSSLGAGAMTELGPFRVNPDKKTLWFNKNAWNKVANVIFLESPSGVGFSYSNTPSDYITGDKRTAADTYTFLVNWLERFPEYKTRDFYVAGESYAGHYVPQLAKLILQSNKITSHTKINLRGIAIGNAYIDAEDTTRGQADFFWEHGLISDEIYEGIVQNCNFSSLSDSSDLCSYYGELASEAIDQIFLYDIYAPVCSSSSNVQQISIYDPCSSDYVLEYLNTPEVQKALHANITGSIPGPWDFCSNRIEEWQDNPDSVLPTIKELMATGISTWIYSGDTDGVVPFTSTKYSLTKLKLKTKTPWYPWYTQGEVGGYAVGYENLTFVTIRGAGHFVPSYQPERALTFFSAFIAGKLPPKS